MATQGVPAEVEDRITDSLEMAHVATCRANRPHVAPVWYTYRDGTVEFVTEGTKLENVRENPRVAISIESSTDGHGEWHVVLFGTASVTTDEEALWAGRTRLFRKYRDREPTLAADGEPPEALVTVDVASTSA
ncbi:MAG: pyridoxamine 5'-phosphate oxidase family protein [Halobacteriaceae archaeon]